MLIGLAGKVGNGLARATVAEEGNATEGGKDLSEGRNDWIPPLCRNILVVPDHDDAAHSCRDILTTSDNELELTERREKVLVGDAARTVSGFGIGGWIDVKPPSSARRQLLSLLLLELALLLDDLLRSGAAVDFWLTGGGDRKLRLRI